VKPGDWFVALKGEKRDGHDFVKDVLERGAGGVVVSREVKLDTKANCLRVGDPLKALQALGAEHRRRWSGRVIGITGSNGKTTTKDMTAQVLAAMEAGVLSTRGNLNSQVGLPLMLLELTPEHGHAVFEMGASEKGNIARLCALARPQVSVLTNVGRAHLEFFGSLEGVAAAKWEIVEGLPADGLAVLNGDDPLVRARRPSAKCPVILFGLSKDCDVRAENIRQEPYAVFDLVMGGIRRAVQLPSPGTFNVYNALAAAAIGVHERIPLNSIVRALETFTPPLGRMQIRNRADGAAFLLDAYNANPNSMRASLASFVGAFPSRRRVAVLGSMKELGPGSEAEHAGLGEYLASLPLERVYFVGEEGRWVEEGFLRAGGQKAGFLAAGKAAVTAELKASLTGKTAVLFKASRSVALEDVFEPLLKEE
jgi:UDP-N-acetylmuramoyl-tripeptide--D-alanyl-D-alanine ligase